MQQDGQIFAGPRVRYGAATEVSVEVSVSLPAETIPHGTRVQGRVRGPFCRRARTLPSSAVLQPSEEPGVWRATVLDPCFWSAELPSLYRVEIQSDGGQQFQVEFGIRRLAPFQRHLWHEGRRWVMRGAWWGTSVAETDLTVWHDTPLSLVAREPSARLCDEASRLGVVMAVWMPAEQVERQLAYYARWAAVAMAIVDGDVGQSADDLRAAAPNLVLAQTIRSGQATPPARWAQVLLVADGSRDAVATATGAQPARPVIAARPLSAPTSAAEARRACDRLQQDLAPEFDLSGYVV